MSVFNRYLLVTFLFSGILSIEAGEYGRHAKKALRKRKEHSRTVHSFKKGRTAYSFKPPGNSAPLLDFRKDRTILETLNNKTQQGILPKDSENIRSCPKESLPPIQPPSYQGDESQIIAERIIEQNRYLLLQSHKAAIFGINTPPDGIPRKEPAPSILLLNLTGETFKKYCPVPDHYIDNAVQVFTNLHNYVNPDRESFTSEQEYNWIAYILGKCHADGDSNKFLLNEPCEDEIIGTAATNEPICPNSKYWSTDPNYDTVVETVWRIFELVHTVCFQKFHGFYRLWHRFAMAIEDLFTQPIKQRWRTPPGSEAKSEHIYIRLLGPDYETVNTNIDKCVDFYAWKSPLKARLDRFTAPHTVRYSKDIPLLFDDPIIKELTRDFVAVAAETAAEANRMSAPAAPET